jgi:hypothetical protein
MSYFQKRFRHFATKAIRHLDNQLTQLRIQHAHLILHQKQFLDQVELVVNLIMREARETRVDPREQLKSIQAEFEPHETHINDELKRIADEMCLLYTFKNETEQEIRDAEIYEESQELPIYDIKKRTERRHCVNTPKKSTIKEKQQRQEKQQEKQQENQENKMSRQKMQEMMRGRTKPKSGNIVRDIVRS